LCRTKIFFHLFFPAYLPVTLTGNLLSSLSGILKKTQQNPAKQGDCKVITLQQRASH
jgi:hypothetical protein